MKTSFLKIFISEHPFPKKYFFYEVSRRRFKRFHNKNRWYLKDLDASSGRENYYCGDTVNI